VLAGALAGLGIVVPSAASAAGGSGGHGRGQSAAKIVDAMEPGFNLGNNLDAIGPDETAWGFPRITPEFLESIRDYGFNSVRIPVTWGGHQGPAPDYTVDTAWMDRVEEVVNYALDEDLYVLLDVHHDSGWIADMPTKHDEVRAQYDALWAQIAERFKDYPRSVLFESINEPVFNGVDEATANELLDELNREFHRIVRGTGGGNADRVLVMPTLLTNAGQQHLDALKSTFDELGDSNVAATIHYYGFWPFSVNIAGFTTFDERVVEDITGAFDRTHDTFTANGIPVIIGEWSLLGYAAGGKVQQGETLKFLEFAYHYAQERDLTVMLWDCAPHYNRWDHTWDDQELWEMFETSWTSRSGTASSDTVFVERADAIGDATLTLNLNGLKFKGLREGNKRLVKGRDYTVSGDQLTIKAATLQRIVGTDGYGNQGDLRAVFSDGMPWRISIVAYDDPSAADATGTADAFAIPTQFRGDQVKTMESVYEDGTPVGPANWTRYQEYGYAYQPEYSRGEITLLPRYFENVEDDRPVTLTFHFWSGATISYQVVKSGDTVTGTAL
jgi:aryl-phospho-beta-D-glucosidase BglC (GH1 family)